MSPDINTGLYCLYEIKKDNALEVSVFLEQADAGIFLKTYLPDIGLYPVKLFLNEWFIYQRIPF